MVKKCISIIISLILLLSVFVTPAFAYMPSTFTVRAEGCLLASADTGEIIYNKNANSRLFPASLTKIMTAIVVLDECKDPAKTPVTVTEDALTALAGTDSALFVVEGEQFTVLDLLYILLVKSGNDAANTLAIHFGGSIEGFVAKMNQKAKQLGMKSTNFVNPHGLHHDNHYTTPNDLFILTKYALGNPTFKEIFGTVRYYVPATNKNDNRRILATTVFIQDPNSEMPSTYYKYVTGGKTGYTDPAGRCLITVAEKGGTSYICVLMKSNVKDENGRKVRYEFEDTKKLFEWAYETFEYRQIFDTATPVHSCKVEMGADTDEVSVVLKQSVNAIVPKNADKTSFKVEVDLHSETVNAPIKKGQTMGTATITYAGEIIDTVDVIAMTSVEEADFFGIIPMSSINAFLDFFVNFFSSDFFIILICTTLGVIVLFIAYCIWLNRNRRKRRHTKNVRYRRTSAKSRRMIEERKRNENNNTRNL